MKPQTVDEYIDSFDARAQSPLRELRRLCRSAAPSATEQLKWGSPAYVHPSGTILFIFSAHREHVNMVFTPSTREAFDAELTGFTSGKGRVALPYGSAVPTELMARMLAYRVREHEDDGVLWK